MFPQLPSVPEVLEALRQDRITAFTIEHNDYAEVRLGRAGRVLVALRREALPVVAAALASEAHLYYGGTGQGSPDAEARLSRNPSDPEVLTTPQGPPLPLRLRDYALLILAQIRGERCGFGPGTPFAIRDELYHRAWLTL